MRGRWWSRGLLLTPHKNTGRCWDCCGFLLVSNPGSLSFTTPVYEAKAGRAGLVPGVVGLVTVGTTVDNILFCLILNQALLFSVGSAAHHTLDDVCTGVLMLTKAVAAVTPQWFEHPVVKVESLPATQEQLE